MGYNEYFEMHLVKWFAVCKIYCIVWNALHQMKKIVLSGTYCQWNYGLVVIK